ncbi:PIG-L family deacetylase [Flavisolibacter ginsenosidimutans]|uniref:PIG-L family deacetylase n=1 Tax=Flavisolibacter ginsenosidimutans TaxID=661481 RepID=A0A5B8UI12_9BACT|nr:PIG-L family deacetylase [Flavisolibacter ginsenosidimutans]QEC55730.1 PIG-L family deacetylase [Flavisolibacter ginsenosidimutans]
MKKIFLAPFAFIISFFGQAQTPSFPTSGDIYLGIKKLNVLGSVLYFAAHPDDENTRLLTYFSKDKLYRTGYLSLTRGDGGQNLIGDEQGIELGLIRTQELLAARRIDGAEQFFSRAYDFGYSKSPEETFTKWDREKILSDAVWVIRKFEPDVIITRFPTTGEGGHGQHTASAIIAVEAFRAAADPKRFPEQLQWVKPWQAKRLLWNTFNFGSANTTSPDQFKIDVGGFNPVLGKSYGEIAAESRSQHKSQGFGVARSRGEAIEFFRTLDGDAPANDLHEGVKTDWSKVASGTELQAIQSAVNDLTAGFDFSAPQKAVPQLLKLYKLLQASSFANSVWGLQKQKEIKDLIVAASGLWIEAFSNVPSAAQGDSLQISVALNNRLGQPMRLQKISGGTKPGEITKAFDTVLAKNRNFVFAQKIKIANDAPITQPYWLQEKMSAGYYNVASQQLIGQPDVQPAATVDVTLFFDDVPVTFSALPVRYKFNDQVRGELYEPLIILPPFTLETSGSVNVLKPKQAAEQEFTYTAQKNLDSVVIYDNNGIVLRERNLPKGERKTYNGAADFYTRTGKQSTSFLSTISYFEKPQAITAKTLHTIRYEHIPYINYFTDAVNKYVVLDVKTEGKKIGYIVGAGDKVPEALEQMGYDVTLLGEKELERNNLRQFDAIIAGVRAFNANDFMGKYYTRLMKYVQDGGNYIVQYSQNNNIRSPKIGPYNFTVSNRRITDENAAVTFLKPGHPVLNFPNKITQDDFAGWIQERSIYHADNWDGNYEAILRMNDPGEAPNDGSLIVTKYGKGFFTYTGLVFFRELPAGVPGAYRLLANIIALNKIKGM